MEHWPEENRGKDGEDSGVRSLRSSGMSEFRGDRIPCDQSTNQPAFALAAADLSFQGALARTAIIESIQDTHLQVMGPNYSGRDLSEGCITSQTKSRTLQY